MNPEYWIYYEDWRAGLLGPCNSLEQANGVVKSLLEDAEKQKQRLVIRVIEGRDVTSQFLKEVKI